MSLEQDRKQERKLASIQRRKGEAKASRCPAGEVREVVSWFDVVKETCVY